MPTMQQNENGEWEPATPMRTPWGVRFERWWRSLWRRS
jgi:hypothetical protein